MPRRALAFVLVAAVAALGCGGGMAPVTGTVKAKGQPVKGGTLVFSPADSSGGAKAATAEIKSDGTYAVGTNGPSDGATVGKYRVSFSPPPQELTEEQRTNPKYIAPPPLYVGFVVQQNEVEVKSGPNTIDLEIGPGAKK